MITLATLPKATKQKVFNQVARHLLTQKAKSWFAKNGVCAYRSPGGLKCAAGCLIADDEYSARMEYCGWRELAEHNDVPREHSDLIVRLQNIHDEAPVEYWLKELSYVARVYRLKTHVLKEFE